LQAIILDNKNFGFGRKLSNKFDLSFFRELVNGEENLNEHMILGLRWMNLIDRNLGLKTSPEIAAVLNLNRINDECYHKLKAGYSIAKKKYYSVGKQVSDPNDFLLSGKNKGMAKKIRNLFIKSRKPEPPGPKFKKFGECAELADVPEPNKLAATWNLSWNKSFLMPEIRIFLFRFYSNTLKINSRTAHFNADIPPTCDFCSWKKIFPAPKESILHLFWFCPVLEMLLSHIFAELFGNALVTKDTYFTGIFENRPGNDATQELHLIIFNIIKYVIWEFKWSKKNPDRNSFAYRVKFYLNLVFRTSNKIKNIAITNNLFYLTQR
jgi:zinc-binding in reverse transcriptase